MRKSMRIASFILSVLVLVSVVNIDAFAADYTQAEAALQAANYEQAAAVQPRATSWGSLSWNLDSAGTLTINGTGDMPYGTMPWAEEKDSIKKIVIGDGITSIRQFYNYSRLQTVVIGSGVKELDSSNFSDCYSLQNVTLGKNVTSIGSYVFSACEKLTSLTIPAKVSSISTYAFGGVPDNFQFLISADNPYYSSSGGVLFNKDKTVLLYVHNRNLTQYTVPSTVKRIEKNVFSSFTKLTSVTIPEGVQEIGERAFNYTGITNLTLPRSLTKIGESAFGGCASLKNVQMQDNVTELGNGAFANCTALMDVKLSNKLGGLYGTFSGCTSLTNVTLPNQLKVVGASTFLGCTSLAKVTLPNTVTTIGQEAFKNCENLKEISIPQSTTDFDQNAFSGTPWLKAQGAWPVVNGQLLVYQGTESSVQIPSNITGISDRAFAGNKTISEVQIPDTVKTIGTYLFSSCTNLTKVTLPTHLTSIPQGMFYGCKNLSGIQIPSGVHTIGGSAFNGCTNLTNIKLPERVTSIENDAFYQCKGLTKIKLPKELKTIGMTAFYQCTALTQMKIPEGIESIGARAFVGCTQLEIIDAPKTLQKIGENAFTNTKWIKDQGDFPVLGDGILVRYMGQGGEVVLPSYVHSIASNAFNTNSSITKVTIPHTVKTIGAYAFQWDHALTEVVIEEGVQEIGEFAFWYCENLKYVEVPTSVKKIGAGAFGFKHSNGYILNSPVEGFTLAANSGTAAATYANKYDLDFKYLDACDLSNATVTLAKTSYTYTGSAIKPAVTVEYKGNTLKSGTDYTVTYSNNTNAGTASVTVTAKGIHRGSKKVSFTIGKTTPTISYATTAVAKKTNSAAFTNKLTSKTDGKITYSSSKTSVATVNSAGKVTIKGKGTTTIKASAAAGANYKAGSASYTLTVTAVEKKNVSKATVTLSTTSYTYNGEAKKPTVTVKYSSTKLKKDTDYTVSYSNNTNAGTAKVSVKGIGAYTGTITKSFTIKQASPTLTFAETAVLKDKNATAFTNKLTKKTDGTIKYTSSNTAVATVSSTTGKVTIKGIGSTTIKATASAGTNYKSGSKSYTLTVTKPVYGLENLTYSFGNYHGAFDYPNNYRIPLSSYQVIYNNTMAKNLYANVGYWGGNCFGMASTSAMFNTRYVALTSFNSTATKVSQLKIHDKSQGLGLELVQYIEAMQVSQYSSAIQEARQKNYNQLDAMCDAINKNANPVSIGVYGRIGSSQGGHALVGYKIEKVSATTARLYVYDCNFPGQTRYITLTTNSAGDYVKWYYYLNDSYHWGSNYSDSFINYVPYESYQSVWKNRASKNKNTTNVLYSSSEDFVIKDYEGKTVATVDDGELETSSKNIYQYDALGINKDNTIPEEPCLIYLPTDVYKVVNLDDDEEHLTMSMINEEQCSTVNTTADELTFAVSDEDRVNTVSIVAEKGESYNVVFDSSLDEAEVEEEVKFSGTGTGSSITVGMSEGSMVVTNCTGVSIWIDGEQVGNTSSEYQTDIQSMDITLEETRISYTGKNLEPDAIVRNGNYILQRGTEYVVVYSNNIKEGTATAVIYGIGAYKGSVTKTFTIAPCEHQWKTITSKASTTKNGKKTVCCKYCDKVHSVTPVCYPKTIKLSTTTYTYNGKKKTPSVTVTDSGGTRLKLGTDYTVKYSSSSRTSIGTYTVTITFIKDIKGSVKKTFTIIPAKTKITSLKNVSSKKAAVKWSKVSKASGYVIYRATSKNGTYKAVKTITKGSTVSYTNKSLKKGKTYYYKVRAYTTVGGKRIYGSYSTVVGVKVKK